MATGAAEGEEQGRLGGVRNIPLVDDAIGAPPIELISIQSKAVVPAAHVGCAQNVQAQRIQLYHGGAAAAASETRGEDSSVEPLTHSVHHGVQARRSATTTGQGDCCGGRGPQRVRFEHVVGDLLHRCLEAPENRYLDREPAVCISLPDVGKTENGGKSPLCLDMERVAKRRVEAKVRLHTDGCMELQEGREYVRHLVERIHGHCAGLCNVLLHAARDLTCALAFHLRDKSSNHIPMPHPHGVGQGQPSMWRAVQGPDVRLLGHQRVVEQHEEDGQIAPKSRMVQGRQPVLVRHSVGIGDRSHSRCCQQFLEGDLIAVDGGEEHHLLHKARRLVDSVPRVVLRFHHGFRVQLNLPHGAPNQQEKLKVTVATGHGSLVVILPFDDLYCRMPSMRTPFCEDLRCSPIHEVNVRAHQGRPVEVNEARAVEAILDPRLHRGPFPLLHLTDLQGHIWVDVHLDLGCKHRDGLDAEVSHRGLIPEPLHHAAEVVALPGPELRHRRRLRRQLLS
mmetsp:Transcript_46560/g.101275  ORF Transcript_46560/g.101275 Transcript_46560/m.101275 type:complete len:507 (-) Transcript_46560:4-1524(-)